MKKPLNLCLILVVLSACPHATSAQSAPPGTDVYLAPLSLAEGRIEVGRPVNITSRPGYDNQPFFAQDETFILFTSADTTGATDIYRYDIKNKHTVQVTNTPESEYSPTVIAGTRSFSTVRVEAGGTQRLWRFDLDGKNPQLVLADVDSVGYHAWITENELGLFVLGSPHTLRIADVRTGTDRVVALDIGRCLQPAPRARGLSFVQIAGENESWITLFDLDTGNTRRLVKTLPGREDFAWIPGDRMIMADDSILYLWALGDEWEEIAALGRYGIKNITRLAVSASGRRLALVADDS